MQPYNTQVKASKPDHFAAAAAINGSRRPHLRTTNPTKIHATLLDCSQNLHNLHDHTSSYDRDFEVEAPGEQDARPSTIANAFMEPNHVQNSTGIRIMRTHRQTYRESEHASTKT
jgi:hypothetical protein